MQYLYNVAMTCAGCSTAIGKVLKRRDDVSDVQFDMEQQTVTVTSNASKDEILDTIKKTGKKVTGEGVVV
ncbi:Metal homeostasis factor ATX1 [Neolecta irregularis DAH-3]|uniref:Metal homeostasis factor ATX1 n=1 Tax=Neolecta irregularis (strain DAH-3) TaxID=1198029 RepID=A0A1U7LHT4_NEOID|nr:Metal homeostasis factor ATX1 [Neolecta irregularis DAH-3]|eukprot:OLL22112.1 Metal homeostasis factor ATX1 [Neolecta irregularis DAH-3]